MLFAVALDVITAAAAAGLLGVLLTLWPKFRNIFFNALRHPTRGKVLDSEGHLLQELGKGQDQAEGQTTEKG